MKEFYIGDAAQFENQVITSSFVVSSKQAKPKKSGELYLALTLSDRTGHIDAKMWDNVSEYLGCFEQDDFVKIRGLINKFNGRFQLTIQSCAPWKSRKWNMTIIFPAPPKILAPCGARWANSCRRLAIRICARWCRHSWLIPKLRAPTKRPLRPSRCTMLLSADCWTTWFHSCSCAIWRAEIIRK